MSTSKETSPVKVSSKGNSYSNMKYKDLRNYQAQQQAIFIALLNHYYDITISRSLRKTSSTIQFLNIKTICNVGQEPISFEDTIQRRREEKINDETKKGIPFKTAIRRLDNYKFSECLHLLMDLLLLEGYFFNIRLSMGKNNSDRADTALAIFYQSKLIFSEDEIQSIGTLVNSKLLSYLESSSFTIEKGTLDSLVGLCK